MVRARGSIHRKNKTGKVLQKQKKDERIGDKDALLFL